jgi:hypothetical protein
MYTAPSVVALGDFRTATQAGGSYGDKDFFSWRRTGYKCTLTLRRFRNSYYYDRQCVWG